jgi:cytochrome b561
MTADRHRSPQSTTVRPDFVLLILAGLLSLIHDTWMKPGPAAALNTHILFGALLWAWVVVRFYRRMRRIPRMQPSDIREFSRHLSRLVYLLLYLLMFFSITLRFLRYLLHRSAVGSAEDFQSYLAFGILALVIIHALAALCRQFLVHGARPRLVVSGKRTADVA